MNKLVVKVIFNLDIFRIEGEIDKIEQLEKTKSDNIETVATLDYIDDNSYYVCYMIIDKMDLIKYENDLIRLELKYMLHDVSEDILMGNVDPKLEFKKHRLPENIEEYIHFFESLEEWVFQHQDIDNILDMITEVGYTNLREIDKKFLNWYSMLHDKN